MEGALVALRKWMDWVHPLVQAEFEGLAGSLAVRRFQKGETLLAVGQVQREMYFVVEGVQMSFFEGLKRQHVVAFTYAPGPCAIPDSFLGQTPSQHTLVCLTDSVVFALPWEGLQSLFDDFPGVERLFRKAAEALLAGSIQRQVELQSLTMEERFRAFTQRSAHLLQSVPHKYIASYLDMDATNFSKLYNSMRI